MSYRFALAGNPNAGKTTLFNQLTGSTAHVGNWPGVTVEKREGRYRGKEKSIDIIDLPGIYSLSPYTPEEIVTRQYILDEHPDVVINIVDATNLARNLYLTTQLMETGARVLIALNMMDVVTRQGDDIDMKRLEKALGAPVVPISAARGAGIDELMRKAIALAGEPFTPISPLSFGPLADITARAQARLESDNIEHPLYHAVKLIENDQEALRAIGIDAEKPQYAEFRQSAETIVQNKDIVTAVANIRYQYISQALDGIIRKKAGGAGLLTRSDKIDRVLTHPVGGVLVFLAIMFLVFHLTFTENLFWLQGALGLEEGILGPGRWLEAAFAGAIDSLMAVIAGGLASAGAAEWAQGLIVDGALAGVGAVLGFLPLVLILYLFISILEDSGYMARAAYLMDHWLRKVGLSGKAFVPMLMGFGCSVPAISATRTLENEKDRRITMMLVPFMSCGAKLPIYTVIGGALFPQHADFVVYGMYLLGIIVAILAAVLLKKLVFKGDAPPFIMEMPAYHRPTIKNLLLHLWQKAKGFLVKAGTIILGASIVLWFLANFNFSLQMVEANSGDSIIGILGGYLKYIFLPLGFVAGPEGWKAAVAVVTGLVAKEAVVSTLGQLYNPSVEGDVLEDEGAQSALMATLATAFSPLAALSFMAFNLLSIPCMAAVGALRLEMQNRKNFWLTLLFWFATAWVVSFLIYQVGGLIFPGLK